VKQFVFADEVGYLHFRLHHRLENGSLIVQAEPKPDYLKTHRGAVRLMGGQLPPGVVSTVRFIPRHDTINYSFEPLEAKMYACCFVSNDLRNRRPYVDVRTVFGKEAEQFGFRVLAGPIWNPIFVQSYQPRHIIKAMAMKATRRAQDVGMLLV